MGAWPSRQQPAPQLKKRVCIIGGGVAGERRRGQARPRAELPQPAYASLAASLYVVAIM